MLPQNKVSVGMISKCGAAEAWVLVGMIAPIQNIGNLQYIMS
jgi:hypothetical protein